MLATQDITACCKEVGVTALHIKLCATSGTGTKTPGPGTQSALQALAHVGMKIGHIVDMTPMPIPLAHVHLYMTAHFVSHQHPWLLQCALSCCPNTHHVHTHSPFDAPSSTLCHVCTHGSFQVPSHATPTCIMSTPTAPLTCPLVPPHMVPHSPPLHVQHCLLSLLTPATVVFAVAGIWDCALHLPVPPPAVPLMCPLPAAH